MDVVNRNDRRSGPTLRWERDAWRQGKLLVAGVDEAGRGAWAGPLVAAAVMLPTDPARRGTLTRAINRANTSIRDSKQLSPEHRRRVRDILDDLEIPQAVAVIEVAELDVVGLGVANRLALCRAAEGLAPSPEHVLVDAFRLNDLRCTHEPIIRGDNLSQSIALASIVAKLHRDALMADLSERFPAYGFAAHKGYGTAAHRDALLRHGLTPFHRRSFAPIAGLLADGADD